MSDQPNSTEAPPIEVECPKCKHKFWHKIGHGLKQAGIAVAEAAVEIALPPNFGGSGS